MKKSNLLSKAELKKIKGGGGTDCASFQARCGITDSTDLVVVDDVCCTTLADAEHICRSRGYLGTYACIIIEEA